MFGLGMGELLVIGIFALLFIGPKKLPDLAKGLGRGIREFQKAKNEITRQVHEPVEELKNSAHEMVNEVKEEVQSSVEETIQEADNKLGPPVSIARGKSSVGTESEGSSEQKDS